MPTTPLLTYAGVGSRNTPQDVLAEMSDLASRLRASGWTLRSGAAEGADSAWESGAGNAAEIFTPWATFGAQAGRKRVVASRQPNWSEALRWAREVHPAWARLSPGARALHARNVYQILGAALNDPVSMVLCWTPDGAERESETSRSTGGTRTAIVLADRLGIPVFNLHNRHHLACLELF